MGKSKQEFETIDEYISLFPKEVATRLQTLRQFIRKEIPDAEETISYKIPTFKRHGSYVVYFSAHKNHISLQPTTPAIEEELQELSKYKKGAGTLQFPLDQPLPLPLIRKVVKLMSKENKQRTKKEVTNRQLAKMLIAYF